MITNCLRKGFSNIKQIFNSFFSYLMVLYLMAIIISFLFFKSFLPFIIVFPFLILVFYILLYVVYGICFIATSILDTFCETLGIEKRVKEKVNLKKENKNHGNDSKVKNLHSNAIHSQFKKKQKVNNKI